MSAGGRTPAQPLARRLLSAVDSSLSPLGSRFERPSLISFLFHSVFESDDEIDSGLVYPQEAVTLTGFRVLVEYFLDAGYRFVVARDIEAGLQPPGSFVWLTFDDGYANNRRIVELLREYGIRATLFVATGYVESGRRFWWDAIYAERHRRGVSAQRIEAEIETLKRRGQGFVDSYLEREFGPRAHSPRGELDCPLTSQELGSLAQSALVEIGNHTVDHAILPLLSSTEIERQLVGAQERLRDLTGVSAGCVAYPNGDYDGRVLDLARRAGLSIGVTTAHRKNRLPVPRSQQLELGRFQLDPVKDVRAQAQVVRSEVQITNAARRLRRRVRRI